MTTRDKRTVLGRLSTAAVTPDPRKPVPLNHPFAGNWPHPRDRRRDERLTRVLGGLLLIAAFGALGILATWEFMGAVVLSPVWR